VSVENDAVAIAESRRTQRRWFSALRSGNTWAACRDGDQDNQTDDLKGPGWPIHVSRHSTSTATHAPTMRIPWPPSC